MQTIENMSVKALYRGILRGLKTYPSKNRDQLLEVARQEFRDGKKLTNELAIAKAVRKARMGYAHLLMYQAKMKELDGPNTRVERPVGIRSFALAPKDPEFEYF